jgi:tRNA dimethylallyltransferase
VVSADSCQIYRELSVGTAKPVRDAAGLVDGVAYHMLDQASIAENFDAGRYARAASACIAEISARGRTPIVAGGTGLYLKALLEGLAPLPPRDPEARRRLEAEAQEHGRASLHARLARLDPEAAAAIPANNIQRTVRALEVIGLTGRPISELWRQGRRGSLAEAGLPAPRAVLRIDWPAEELRQRIARRSRGMWPDLLEEVRGLLKKFSGTEPGFQSLGYAEAVACARGELPPQEGLARLVASTCAYAKRQRTWFRTQLAAQPLAGGDPDSMLRGACALISPK